MKLTLFNNPVEFVKFWFGLHKMALKYCGNWFGVILFPTGRVMLVNGEFAELVRSNMKEYDFVKK